MAADSLGLCFAYLDLAEEFHLSLSYQAISLFVLVRSILGQLCPGPHDFALGGEVHSKIFLLLDRGEASVVFFIFFWRW